MSSLIIEAFAENFFTANVTNNRLVATYELSYITFAVLFATIATILIVFLFIEVIPTNNIRELLDGFIKLNLA